MTAKSLKQRNIKRWGIVHALAMQILGYPKNDCEHFFQVGYFVYTWVELTGKLPKTQDFIACKSTIEILPHT